MSQLAHAEEISSVYTELNVDKDCTTFAMNEEGGEFANLACNGYGGYPVLIYSADLRESIYYGFPKGGDLAPAWESFAAFNSAGPKIEWRVAKDGGRTIPFATIHRWSVSDPEDADKKVEVLVVEKVGQLVEQDGCAVGLVRGDRQSQGQRDGAQRSPTSRPATSPAAATSACWSASRCRSSTARRTEASRPSAQPVLPRSIASTIICLARAASCQPAILTHLPGSRSL